MAGFYLYIASLGRLEKQEESSNSSNGSILIFSSEMYIPWYKKISDFTAQSLSCPQFEKRYEIKWLGYNSANCPESSEKSKTFVGIRTEIDPVTHVMTQDQTQLIRKAAVRFQ